MFTLLFSDVILKFREKIENLEKDVYAVLCLEREEREMQQSEAQVRDFFRIFFFNLSFLESGVDIVHKEVTLLYLTCLLLKGKRGIFFLPL